jgi:hypothetical protein
MVRFSGSNLHMILVVKMALHRDQNTRFGRAFFDSVASSQHRCGPLDIGSWDGCQTDL